MKKGTPGCLGYRGVYCPVIWGLIIHPFNSEVADLSQHFRKRAATDGRDLNVGETRVWRLDSGPNLQPYIRGVCFMIRVVEGKNMVAR